MPDADEPAHVVTVSAGTSWMLAKRPHLTPLRIYSITLFLSWFLCVYISGTLVPVHVSSFLFDVQVTASCNEESLVTDRSLTATVPVCHLHRLAALRPSFAM